MCDAAASPLPAAAGWIVPRREPPQQLMTFLLPVTFVKHSRRFAAPSIETCDDARGPRQTEPQRQPFAPRRTESDRERRCGPEARAVETPEERAPETVAEPGANAREESSRPVLCDRQVRDAPDRQRRHDERAERDVHRRKAPARGCARRHRGALNLQGVAFRQNPTVA